MIISLSFRNGRAPQRPPGHDDGSRPGPQSADSHRKQVINNAAVKTPTVLCAELFQHNVTEQQCI